MAEVYTEEVGQRLDDDTWIREQTEAGCVLFTKDHNILGKHRETLIEAGSRLLAVPDAGAGAEALAERFIRHRYRIAPVAEAWTGSLDAPAVAPVSTPPLVRRGSAA
jgi:hypothetical protein